jgi:hypothetical protein
MGLGLILVLILCETLDFTSSGYTLRTEYGVVPITKLKSLMTHDKLQMPTSQFSMPNAQSLNVDAILERAISGCDLSPQEGWVLLQQNQPSIIKNIFDTADNLRQQQAGNIAL